MKSVRVKVNISPCNINMLNPKQSTRFSYLFISKVFKNWSHCIETGSLECNNWGYRIYLEINQLKLHGCPKCFFIILIVLVEKKHTKLIYHMPWLYQYPPLHFPRSYKKYSKILKNYPPWIMKVLQWNVLISIVIVGNK